MTVNGDFNGDGVEHRGTVTVARQFSSRLTYPNPFSPSGIDFDLPGNARVTLEILDTDGREVARLLDSNSLSPGTHHVELEPSLWGSGTDESDEAFYYRLSIEVDGKSYIDTKQIVFVKP